MTAKKEPLEPFQVHDIYQDVIGEADSIGKAKQMIKDSLPPELAKAYAGLSCGQELTWRMAHPAFYPEFLPADILQYIDEHDDCSVQEAWQALHPKTTPTPKE